MKLTRTKILLFIAVTALLVSIPAIVSAQTERPHIVRGVAKVNSQPVPANIPIAALIDDERVEEVNTIAGGSFVLVIPPPTDGSSFANKPITFTINGAPAQETATWISGPDTVIDLNTAGPGSSRATNTPTPRPTVRPRTTTTTAGPRGPAGPAGPAGPRGPAGSQGDPGAAGEAGQAGSDGAVGPQGPKGDQGPVGPPGGMGAQGPEGPRGETGAQGHVGQTGSQGVAGPPGATGVQGPSGPPGSSGNFMIAIIALVIALLALLVAIGRWIWELQTG